MVLSSSGETLRLDKTISKELTQRNVTALHGDLVSHLVETSWLFQVLVKILKTQLIFIK